MYYSHVYDQRLNSAARLFASAGVIGYMAVLNFQLSEHFIFKPVINGQVIVEKY